MNTMAANVLGVLWLASIGVAWHFDSTRSLLAMIAVAVTALHGKTASSRDGAEDRAPAPSGRGLGPMQFQGWH